MSRTSGAAAAAVAEPSPAPVKLLRPHEVAYSRGLAEAICARFADGESLRQIGADPAMPAKATILRWLAARGEFRALYEVAWLQRADTDAEAVGEIAREVLAGRIGATEARVALDALKWAAAIRAPRKYGARLDPNLEGGAAPAAEVDRPPRETREAWLERRRIELGAAAGAADGGDQR